MYFKNFHAFRFIAALAIVVLHIELMGHRYGLRPEGVGDIEFLSLGVDFFFVLSGFLITALLLVERNSGRIRLRRFFLRRMLRIAPLYYLIVAFVFFVVPLCGLPVIPGMRLEDGFAPQLVLHLALLPQVAKSYLSFLPYGGQLWSIGVEVMFYLVWPLFIAAGAGCRSVIITIVVVLAGKGAALLAFGPGYPVCAFLAMSRFEILAMGGLASMFYLNIYSGAETKCFGVDKIVGLLLRSKKSWWVSLFALILAILVTWKWADNFVHLVAGAFFALLLLGSAMGFLNSILLENKAMKFLGEISYGIYVWHFIAVGFVHMVMASICVDPGWVATKPAYYIGTCILTFVLSTASFYLVERPINQLRYKM